MLPYPEIDPVAFSVGPLSVHWYGIAYLLSFVGAWRYALWRSRKPWSPVAANQVEDLIFYGALGVILGGRFGYVFFYQFGRFLDDPLWLLRVWEGGMSFHGGLLGVIAAMWFFGRRRRIGLLQVGDFVAPLAPIGLFLGRLANFVGQELWGRPTSAWYGMVFPADPQQLPRHPSQLYEAMLEGVLLFLLLLWFGRKPRPAGMLSGLFLAGYGLSRFLVEFVRAPDAHLTELTFGWMTRGQLLSLPMVLVGFVLIDLAWKRSDKGENS